MTKSRICLRGLSASVLMTMVAALAACTSNSHSTRPATIATAAAVTPTAIVSITPSPTVTVTSTASPTPNPTATPTATVSPTASPTPIACNSGNQYTFVNNNPYPVWLGEEYQGSGDLASNTIAPPGNDWQMAPDSSVVLCMPAGWSGRFWPRTECDFNLFSNEGSHFKDCTASVDCDSGSGTICVGGKCLLDCSTGGTPFCQGGSGLNNVNASCYGISGANVCSFPGGTVCKTGDCSGLYQCTGVWDAITSQQSGSAPASLFEPTSNGTTNVNYDVSLVSGYNTQIQVAPSAIETPTGANCYMPSCVSDLNATCPADLRVTDAPTATVSTIPCGSGTYCQRGFCDSGTCVIGCNDPGDQCAQTDPPGLLCGSPVPGPSATPTPTYQNMYTAKAPDGNAMSSCGQGTPTCWGPDDCAPNVETCVTGAIASFPSGWEYAPGLRQSGAFISRPRRVAPAQPMSACPAAITSPDTPRMPSVTCVLLQHITALSMCACRSTIPR
jgi:Thaumatin family